jgi:preprotein translocase subunit YajC
MSNYTLILVAIALAVFVFFQFRSSRKRARDTAERQKMIVPGVEVMTNYGLFGTITSIDDDNNFAFLEVSPGTVIKVHKSTILKAADDAVAPETLAEIEQEGGGNTAVELNKDHAILQDEPKFGERIDPATGTAATKPAPRKSTKKTDE